MKPIIRHPRSAPEKWFFGDYEAIFKTICSYEVCEQCEEKIPLYSQAFQVLCNDFQRDIYFHKDCCSIRG